MVAIESRNSRLTLARARIAYRNEPNNPARLVDYMETFWQNRRTKLGVSVSDLVVPTCPWNETQIAQFRGENIPDMARFIPEIVAGDLELIKKGFPEISFYLFGRLRDFEDIRNRYVLKEWGRSEADIDAPYTSINEQELKDKFEALDRLGITVPAYAIFAVFSKDFTKEFLDEIRTVIRITGSTLESSVGGEVLTAGFYPDGRMSVGSSWAPGGRGQGLGWRSFQGA